MKRPTRHESHSTKRIRRFTIITRNSGSLAKLDMSLPSNPKHKKCTGPQTKEGNRSKRATKAKTLLEHAARILSDTPSAARRICVERLLAIVRFGDLGRISPKQWFKTYLGSQANQLLRDQEPAQIACVFAFPCPEHA